MGNHHQHNTGAGDKEQAEHALRASELSYRRLFETARDGILILDFETGRINDVNPFLFDLLGLSRDEMIGKTVGELSPFQDLEENKVMLGRLQKDGHVRYDDLPLKTRDGRHLAVEFVSNVYEAGDDKVIQCNVRDITERKAAESERQRLAAIIEWSQDAIVSKSADGIVIGWNHGAERLYGYLAEEIIGRHISILFPPDHYAEYGKIMKEIRNGKRVPAFDTVRLRKDGVLINVSVGITPIETLDGEIVGASKHSHDISRIKQLEAQFIEAQKMEVIGRLSSSIAHDFNNILAVIIGYGDLVLAQLEPRSPLREYVEEIRHASDRATGLTRQLLVFSRRQVVQLVPLNLNIVLANLDKMLRRLVDDNIEMTFALGKETGYIKGDSGYIGQLLMNLIVNARDAMPNGGRLAIATRNVMLDSNDVKATQGAFPGAYVLLSIGDTGTGITEEVKKHLFKAFFTTKQPGEGTGLGLTTCQTIVQQSGGHILVDSESGAGTTFKIYFPRLEHPHPELAEPVEPPLLFGGSETLLLVEDEPSVRNMACVVLESQGYEVLTANNGQDALQVAREHKGLPIRLVVTDVIMPLMGGKAMADCLKISYPGLKILFTSGYTDDTISRHGVLASGVEFLPKPYTPATLARKVREILDR